MPQILIADDHSLFRRGIGALLTQVISDAKITEAETPDELLELLSMTLWDVILLDFSMPGRSGTEMIKDIIRFAPKVSILVVSGLPEEQFALQVLRAGASGFVNKGKPPKEIATAVKKVIAGGKYVTPEVAEKLVGALANEMAAPHERLSGREMDVLRRIAAGNGIKEIAAGLKLSVATVSTYRVRLLEKMGLKTNAQVMRYALDHHLVE